MKPVLRRCVARLREDRGANLVEAALLTPLLLLVSFSIIEFGALFYVYLSLENGVSQASRYAVTGQVVAGENREQSIKLAMREATPTLTLEDGMFAFSHLPLDAVPGTDWLAGVGRANEIGRVTITYTWNLYTPLISVFFDDGRITLVVESAMKNEQYEDEEGE